MSIKAITPEIVRELADELIYVDESTENETLRAFLEYIVPKTSTSTKTKKLPVPDGTYVTDLDADEPQVIGPEFEAVLVAQYSTREHWDDEDRKQAGESPDCYSPRVGAVKGMYGSKYGPCAGCAYAGNFEKDAPVSEKCYSTTRVILVLCIDGEYRVFQLKAGGGREKYFSQWLQKTGRAIRGRWSSKTVRFGYEDLKSSEGHEYTGYTVRAGEPLDAEGHELKEAFGTLKKKVLEYVEEKHRSVTERNMNRGVDTTGLADAPAPVTSQVEHKPVTVADADAVLVGDEDDDVPFTPGQ